MGISENAIASGDAIMDYIPQRPPIVMVDAFFGIDGNRSCSGLTIAPDNLFVHGSRFMEPGIIEHIAQSCALRVGYLCRERNSPVPLGYIAAVKNMTLHNLPEVGDCLRTTVTVEQEVFDITLISAEIRRNKNLIIACEMKIFLKQ